MIANAAADNDKVTRKHIRGSSLLLAGRMISLGLNFLVQVLTVRYLAKSDYGAFAYALNLASIGSSLVLFSMDKSMLRFLPIYDENGDDNRQRGGIVFTFGMIIGLSLALIVLIYGFQSIITERFVEDQLTVSLLLIIIFFAPVGALDNWFQSIFAVFASAKAIFIRRHILGPALKLAAVLIVMLLQADVHILAWGYVIGGVIGILAYASMLHTLSKKNRVFQAWHLNKLRFPVRDILTFSAPLMYSDLVYILRSNVTLILVEFFHASVGVAEFRAVVPVARLNEVVLQSFTFLYTPVAARLFARKEKEGINTLYWQTALWIIVFSFPVFIVTFSLAEPVTVLLFEERYASSAPILALLSLGYYFNAALGFNNHTLRVYGVIRYLVLIDFIAACTAVLLSLLLIPPYGALGAAYSATGTLITHNLLNHLGLLLHTDIHLFDWRYMKAYVTVVVATGGLLIFQLVAHPPIYIGFPMAILLSVLVLILNRKQLNVADTFPELLRIKIIGKLLGT